MRSPHTIGDDVPRPGRGAFHATPSSLVQRVGRPVSRETPVASGPLQWGQFSAPAVTARRGSITTFSASAFFTRYYDTALSFQRSMG